MNLRPNRVLSQPATVETARSDYQTAHTPQHQAAAREQLGQTRTDGNAATTSWHGRKRTR